MRYFSMYKQSNFLGSISTCQRYMGEDLHPQVCLKRAWYMFMCVGRFDLECTHVSGVQEELCAFVHRGVSRRRGIGIMGIGRLGLDSTQTCNMHRYWRRWFCLHMNR